MLLKNFTTAFHSSSLVVAILVSPFILATLSSISCDRFNEEDEIPAESIEKTVRPVKLFETPSRSQSETRTYPIFVKGGSTAKLSFRIGGKLEEFNAEVGKRFAKGDVVARLESRDYELAVQRVEQSLVEARAGLKAMNTGARPEDKETLEASLAATSSAREAAEKQFARIESLHKDGTVSDAQYDAAKTARDAATSAERAAELSLEKANKGSRDEEKEMLEAKIAGLEIDLQLAKNKVEDTILRAPFDGVVSAKFFDNHETILPFVSIATLVDDATFEGEMSVTEEFVGRLDDVQSVKCTFESLPGKEFSASLKQTSTSLEKGSRAYLATLSIDAQPSDGVLVGMVGEARAELNDDAGTLSVPVAALFAGETEDGETKSFVWLVDKESLSIERRAVEVGVLLDDRAQILSGLEGGETIVGAGARFITDGQPIRLEETED